MVKEGKHTFSKAERLSWKRYIDLLFEKGHSFVAFPLRIVYLSLEKEAEAPAAILISVPKKKIKRAVRRNLIKRQIRETYRVRKHDLTEKLAGEQRSLLLAFLYIDGEVPSFAMMEKAMTKALKILQEKA